MLHLGKYEHDVVERTTAIWCPAEWQEDDVTWDPASADCSDCLHAAAEFGEAVRKRLEESYACTDCGENGFGVHACPGRPGEM